MLTRDFCSSFRSDNTRGTLDPIAEIAEGFSIPQEPAPSACLASLGPCGHSLQRTIPGPGQGALSPRPGPPSQSLDQAPEPGLRWYGSFARMGCGAGKGTQYVRSAASLAKSSPSSQDCFSHFVFSRIRTSAAHPTHAAQGTPEEQKLLRLMCGEKATCLR